MDGPVVDRLRADDHSVIFVAEMWHGIGDTEVLAASRSAEALVITADKDFGELVFRQGPVFGLDEKLTANQALD